MLIKLLVGTSNFHYYFLISANGYDIASLSIIEREEVEALLPPPLLADRTKSIDGLNKWRISQVISLITLESSEFTLMLIVYIPLQGLRPVSKPLKEICQSSSSYKNGASSKTSLGARPRAEWTAQNLISRSKKGIQILEQFKTTNILSKKDRIFITHLIVDEFTDEFGKLTREELINRSAELSVLFPTTEQVSAHILCLEEKNIDKIVTYPMRKCTP